MNNLPRRDPRSVSQQRHPPHGINAASALKDCPRVRRWPCTSRWRQLTKDLTYVVPGLTFACKIAPAAFRPVYLGYVWVS